MVSFKWNVHEINGHNIKDLLNFFANEQKNGKPNLLIANTVKEKAFPSQKTIMIGIMQL